MIYIMDFAFFSKQIYDMVIYSLFTCAEIETWELHQLAHSYRASRRQNQGVIHPWLLWPHLARSPKHSAARGVCAGISKCLQNS